MQTTITAEMPPVRTITFSIPDTDGARAFYSAVSQGQRTLSVRTAQEFGMNRRDFEKMRGVLLKWGFAIYRDDSRPRRGIGLTSAGVILLHRIAALPSPTG